jgi:hypothetical protein
MNFSPGQPFTSSDLLPIPSEQFSSIKVRSRRPCDPCRRRKSRCEIVGDSPPCLLCRFHHQECTFNEEPQPRKRRAIGPHEDERPVSQSDVQKDPVCRSFSNSSRPNTSNIRQTVPIDDYANLKGPSLLKKTLGLQQNRHSRFVGSTSEYEQVLLDLHQDEQGADLPTGTSVLRRVDTVNTAFILSPDAATQNHSDDISDLDAIETIVAPHGQALIHLYFRIVHPSFPILHKKVYLEKYENSRHHY